MSLGTNSDQVEFTVSSRRGGPEVIDEVADEWRSLCDEDIGHQPFFRPEWIRAHIRAHHPNGKVIVIEARRGGRLCFVLPLLEEWGRFGRVPVRKLRAPVDFNVGRFDAVASPGPLGDAATHAAWEFLKGLGGWDVLQFRYVQEHGQVEKLIRAAKLDGQRVLKVAGNPNPFVRIPTDPDLLAQMPLNSRGVRTRLRQVRRKIAEQGSFKFYRVDEADRDALERLYRLEASGWKGREGSAVICVPSAKRFFDEVAESAARFGYLALYMMEFNGTLIAAHLALTHRGRCYSPVTAYDEEFERFSPGHLILSEILQDCATRGITVYDITGENQEWKLRWMNEAIPINHHYIFQGVVGNLAHTVETRLKPAFRKLGPARIDSTKS